MSHGFRRGLAYYRYRAGRLVKDTQAFAAKIAAAIGRAALFFLPRATLVLAAIAFGLLVAEVLCDVFKFDFRVERRMLFYQKGDAACDRPDDDPHILFRLTPGCEFDRGRVQINALGMRDRERTTAKPSGVYRILCVGGSNVYGFGLFNKDTWPAQLETELNARGDGKYEVWNMGVPAYVGEQMAAVAEEALRLYDPDLIIMALSNTGPKAFVDHPGIRAQFESHPQLIRDFFDSGAVLRTSLIPQKEHDYLILHSRLYRFFQAALMQRQKSYWGASLEHERRNAAAVHEFLSKKSDKARVCVFLYPGYSQHGDFRKYYEGTGVPVFILDAENRPEEYAKTHPPAYVFTWYASEIARWLADNGLLQQ